MSHIHHALESLPSGVFFAATSLLHHLAPDDAHKPSVRPRFVNQFPVFPGSKVFQHIGGTQLSPIPAPTQPPSDPILCLPLLDVAVAVRIEGLISQTTLTQRFTNIGSVSIPEAHYTFPLYNGAAVTSFRCYIGDDRVLAGVVKPKEVARLAYCRAIEKMETAALLEEHTPEVFETLLGHIPPGASVKVELSYVHELKIDQGSKGGLVVTVPTSVAPRYGTPPEGFRDDGNRDVQEAGLSITVIVTAPDPIQKIESRTHPISIEMGFAEGPQKTTVSSFSALKKAGADSKGKGKDKAHVGFTATARLSDLHAKMDRDFVLHILAAPKDVSDGRIYSYAVLSPTNEAGHAALMVSLRPCELFDDPAATADFHGEVVFLADRSGSMAGSKIRALRDVLLVFLKSLPRGCTFDIVSFGSTFESMWQKSKAYSQETVNEAVEVVKNFSANLGQTELLSGIMEVVNKRNAPGEAGGSTQVIVLTDGEVWRTEETSNYVRHQRKELGDAIRFFALGIGNEVSHRLVEGIGSEGGGFGEVCGVDAQGLWQERVIAMLKAALSPPSWDCQFELGERFKIKDLHVDPLERHDQDDGDDIISYIRTPSSIPPIHQFARKSIFILLELGDSTPPSEILIRATGPGSAGSNAVLRILDTLRDAKTI